MIPLRADACPAILAWLDGLIRALYARLNAARRGRCWAGAEGQARVVIAVWPAMKAAA